MREASPECHRATTCETRDASIPMEEEEEEEEEESGSIYSTLTHTYTPSRSLARSLSLSLSLSPSLPLARSLFISLSLSHTPPGAGACSQKEVLMENSSIKHYLGSREHNPSLFVLPGAESRDICAPGSTI